MKKCYLLMLVSLFTFTFEPPKPLLTPKTKPAPAQPKKSIKQLIEEDKTRKKEVYYDATHLKELDQKKTQKHAPILITIDQIGQETEKVDNIPMTMGVSYGIKQKIYPMLITGTLLQNLLVRLGDGVPQTKVNQAIKQFTPPFTAQDWRIYDVSNSQFILLVPNNLLNMYGQSLGIKKDLPEITDLLKDASYKTLIEWLNKNKKIVPFSKSDLEKVFVSKNDKNPTPIWDIVVAGHGYDNPPIIANLDPQSINEMFAFFDKYIKTGMVLVSSCYAGGGNRTLLQTTQEGIQINHNFTLILGSVSNEAIQTVYPRDYPYFNLFFNNAAQVQDKGSSFDVLWEDLARARLFSTESSVHGFQNIPQVWFPGGLGFQSANIPDLVFSIGNVFLKKIKEDNGEMNTIGNALVLIYPIVIDVPLFVYPIRLSHKITRKNWKTVPHVFEPAFIKNSNQNTVPFLIKLVSLGFLNAEPVSSIFDSVYPQFISLNTTNSAHLFTEINVEKDYFDDQGKKHSGLGVMQFIRDAFFDVSPSSGAQIYFIDYLTGFNDISLLLAGSRIVRNDPNKHIMEDYLQNLVGQNITLENVMILINNNNVKFTIYFAIGDTYWQYTSTQAEEDAKTLNWWNFKLMGNVRESYDRDYKNYKKKLVQKPETINQKSISAVLEEKHRQILLKQAAELKKKQEEIEKAKKAPRPLPNIPSQAQDQKKALRPLPVPPISAPQIKKAPRPLPTPPTANV